MNHSHRLLLLSLIFLTASWVRSPAQDSGASDAAAPADSTVITSDELRSDQGNHTSVFTGNVVVNGSNFNMTCQEMTVLFTKDGKVDNITATGNVVITQPDRITHSGQAQYFREDDKFILTDQPVIVDNKKNEIRAPIITIYRTKQTMITGGGKSTVTLKNDSISSATSAPSTAAP